MTLRKNSVIIIAGPTAVGKTNIALQLAQHFNTEILSADSRQCYREMEIGTAKPTKTELQTVPHHFINSHSIFDEINAGIYESLALDFLNDIFKKSNIAIVCGGTGLYIDALCNGIDEMPTVDKTIEEGVQKNYQLYGLEWLQQEVKGIDPDFFDKGEIQNPARLQRALSFYVSHHTSITKFRTGNKKERDFNIIKIALQLPREILYERINSRVDKMMDDGLLQEAKHLYPNRKLKSLNTVGYKELFEYFDLIEHNESSLNNAVNLIKQHTRNYAKRQLTWFKRDEEWQWFTPYQYEEILQQIKLIPTK